MPRLFVVATPIGNLEDMTYRAVRVLGEVSYVLAEDTRVTRRLLERYQIRKPLIAWHEHSSERDWQRVKALLAGGNDLAYLTDAGTPGVSDPGGKLVARIVDELPGVQVLSLPGASALTAALSIAGIPLNEFLFFGFLPHKKGRQTKLKQVKESERPVVLFESVHRIAKVLGELAPMGKKIVVCRELTKKFESVYRGSAEEILAQLSKGETKGEFVILVYE